MSWSNLAQVEQAVKDILTIHQTKRKLEAVVHLGDVKHILNPVDQRVSNKAIEIVKRFKGLGIRFLVLLGNHDRLSMSDESQDWFPTLAAAGAETFTDPDVIHISENDVRLFMLPFRRDKAALKVTAAEFGSLADPSNGILCFHEDVSGAKYDRQRGIESGLSRKALHMDKYMFAVGGHVHFRQKIGPNGWYAGSPFAMDWGECNQRKGYLLYSEGRMYRLSSSLPGWYDPSVAGFDKVAPASFKGARVRIRVNYRKEDPNYQQKLDTAQRSASEKYPDAEIVLDPRQLKTEVESIAAEGDDGDIIKAFLKANTPKPLRGQEGALLAYLTNRLELTGKSLRRQGAIDITRVVGRNAMSFETVEVPMQPGITVVTGKNLDWDGRSNGSGKTSLLHLIPIALEGKTLKGQKHDGWVREGSTGPATVGLEMRLPDGSTFEVYRQRRPTRLTVMHNGQDISTGMGQADTQKRIQELTGMTWDILTNAVFIDQLQVNALLHGTPTDRKKLLAQFLNIERFEDAQQVIRNEIRSAQRFMEEWDEEVEASQVEIRRYREFIKDLVLPDTKALRTQLAGLKRAAKTQQENVDQWQQYLDDLPPQPNPDDVRNYTTSVGRVAGRIFALEDQISEAEGQPDKCPTCGQKLNQVKVPPQAKAKAELKKWRVTHKQLKGELAKAQQEKEEWADDRREALINLTAARARLRTTKAEQAAPLALLAAAEQVETKRSKYQSLKRVNMANLKIFKQGVVDMGLEVEFLKFAAEAFSRNGVPAFIMAELCPRLTAAADYYSDLFSDGEITATFAMDKSDIDVQIINQHGGPKIEDQSRGETKMASLILSFALRDVTNPCNILIADEPGDGLDEVNARQFARGLKKVKQRFPVILVCTHDPHILAELSGERQATIIKQNGVSEVTYGS